MNSKRAVNYEFPAPPFICNIIFYSFSLKWCQSLKPLAPQQELYGKKAVNYEFPAPRSLWTIIFYSFSLTWYQRLGPQQELNSKRAVN